MVGMARHTPVPVPTKIKRDPVRSVHAAVKAILRQPLNWTRGRVEVPPLGHIAWEVDHSGLVWMFADGPRWQTIDRAMMAAAIDLGWAHTGSHIFARVVTQINRPLAPV